MSKTIVIIGGGFAGAYLARTVERWLPKDWELILFSKENYLTFTPLLAEVVGSSISPTHVVRPVRQMVRRTICRTAAVTRLDLTARLVEYQMPGGGNATQTYDHLVLACGMVVNTNIIPGVAAHAFALKTLGDALLLRDQLINQLERAEVETDPQRRRQALSFAVIGGGFSGVEVAGEMFDLLTDSRRFYPSIAKKDIRVVLIHSQKQILPELPESLGAYARRRMEARGIEFRLEAIAQGVTENGVRLRDGTVIAAGTVVCTIGNTINPLIAASGLPLERGRLRAEPDMRLLGQTNAWGLGDCTAVPNAFDGKPSPTLAQFALRQAGQLSNNLRRTIEGRPTEPFSFRMEGSFAAIGHHNAVGKVFFLKVSGFFAWVMWRAIYLSKMPTLARKIQVAFDWMLDIFFPRDIVQLSPRETHRVPRAHFEPGEFVFRQGDPPDKFYVIEKGKAGVYLDGWTAAVATLGPGEYFGEHGLLRAGTRPVSVKAEEALDVLCVRRAQMLDVLEHLSLLRTDLEDHLQRLESAWKFRDVVRNHPRLHQLKVRDAMTTSVATIPLELSYADAIAHFQRVGQGPYIVVDPAGMPQGICTAVDLHKALCTLKPLTTPLAQIMSHPIVTVTESDTLADAMQLFLEKPFEHLVVVADADKARPVGMITPFRILLYYAEDIGHGPAGMFAAPVAKAEAR
jgi:NADH dehydrogenase